tara:strand:+ start:723 stop:1043 length:321 start_codon:yes stop_codon:yes gene_type:complete
MTKINEKKQLVNLPVPIERINGNEAGLLNVVKKTITVSKEDFNKPQEWMEQLTRSIESAFTCKSECIAATPPIIRYANPDDLNSNVLISAIIIDVSEVMKKEGLCN